MRPCRKQKGSEDGGAGLVTHQPVWVLPPRETLGGGAARCWGQSRWAGHPAVAAAAAQPSLRPARSPPRQWRPRWERRVPALAGPPALTGRPPGALRSRELAAGGAWPAPRPPRIRAHSWLTSATKSSPHLPPPGPAPTPPPAAQSPGVPWQGWRGQGAEMVARAGRREKWSERQSWGVCVGGGPRRPSPSKVGNQVPAPGRRWDCRGYAAGRPVRGVQALGAVPSWTLSGS